ncbi:MAG: response regulator [Geobacteraceae bacterium]|nr:MAG: response regulator [Geobacteraceae bacterium]
MMGKNETRPLKMLIIDDYKPYVESLHRDAQKFRIILKHAGSLEEGKEVFEAKEGVAISGVILDVKCMKEKSQEVPDNSFITAAVKYFGKKAPHLPVVVLTGETDQYRNLKELYEGTLRVFSKGRDETEMLNFLLVEAQKLDRNKIISQYADVFEGLEHHLGGEAEQELISCLRDMNSSDFTVIKNNLSCLRRLQEKVYIALNKANSNLVPSQFLEGEINVIAGYKHLAEKGYVERYKIIDRFAELVYKITSDNGAHTPHENPKYPPTKYTVQAVTHALLDVLIWFKFVMDDISVNAK